MRDLLASSSAGETPKKAKPRQKLRSIGTDCLFVKADVSIANDCYRLVETALKHFGNVNGLVNSAGLARSRHAA